MDSKQHSEGERAAIARLAGVARRHASLRHAATGGYDPAAAVAELQQISTDAHLLAHATTYPQDFLFAATRDLLEVAGADRSELEAIAARQQDRMAAGRAGRQPAARRDG